MKPQINSYYFGFDATGDPAIDKILDAVASAGHSFHNTQDWNDKLKNLEHAGETPVEWIQNAANESAKSRKNENTYTTTKIEEEITNTDRLEFLLKFFYFFYFGDIGCIAGILYDDEIIDALNGNSYTLPEPISESDKNHILNAVDEAIRKERKNEN